MSSFVATSPAERGTADPVRAVSVVSTGLVILPAHDPTAAQRLLHSA